MIAKLLFVALLALHWVHPAHADSSSSETRAAYLADANWWDLGSVRLDGTNVMLIASTPEPEYFQAIAGGQVIFQQGTAAGGRDLYAVPADSTLTTLLAQSSGRQEQTFLAVVRR